MKRLFRIVSNCFIWFLIIVLLSLLVINAFNKNLVFKIGNKSLFAISGDSMNPVIKDGDLIITKTDTKEVYQENDIVCYYSYDNNKVMIIAHQIVKVYRDDDKILYVTKGINNDYEDEHLVNHDEIIGEYIDFRIPLLGYIVKFSATTWGYFCLVVLPLGVLSVLVIYDFMKEVSKKKEEK